MMTNLCSNYFLRLHFFGFLCKPKPFSGNKQRLASGGCQHSTSFLSALPATPHHTPCWHRFLRVVLYWFSHCYSCAADDDGADLLLVRLMFRLLKVVPWWLFRVGGWWLPPGPKAEHKLIESSAGATLEGKPNQSQRCHILTKQHKQGTFF